MTSQAGSSRKSLSMTNSSLTGKKKPENGGPESARKSFASSRNMYVQFYEIYFVFS